VNWDPDDPRHDPPSLDEKAYLLETYPQWYEPPPIPHLECEHGCLPHDPDKSCECWDG
jgi:hypothetical protein